jgi:RNA-directed DNA polymerase
MHGNSTRENRETQSAPVEVAGRLEKAMSRKSNMHAGGESDGCVIPTKCPNNGGQLPAEDMEGRQPTKENIGQATAPRTQSRISELSDLHGVRKAARKDKRTRFTALLHHVTVGLLRDSYFALKRDAAPGIDGVTWKEYETGLDEKLADLHNRIHRGTYRAQPSKRAYIPKADGRQRPLGIAALEDKVVQQAVVTVLNQIYAEDFLGFSYGFRPGRSQHQALDALWVGIMRKKVNWILDADIRGFFDHLSHEWLVKFIEHRIADRRILRLIQKWLRAGVSEEGKWSKTEVGTPLTRGKDDRRPCPGIRSAVRLRFEARAVASPLLANIYLHYVFDLWVQHWRKHHATGDVIIVRYADDIVAGFENRADAERFLSEWKERLQKFGLELHPDKTRLIEFGREAAANRKQRGEGKPEVFNFLGFTHMCGKTRKTGRFIVKRKTIRKRLSGKLGELKEELRRRWHQPVAEVGKWLKSVVQGYFNYHAVPGNMDSLNSFRAQVIWHWYRALRRRSQHDRMTWARFLLLVGRWIPSAKILHPHPNVRFDAMHPR